MEKLTSAMAALKVEVDKLNEIKKAVALQRNKVLKEMRDSCEAKPNVCVITHKCNHPYGDVFGTDDGGNYVKYRGQMVSSRFDETIMDVNVPKHLLIMKGTKGRFPPMFGDWKSSPKYFYGGLITRVRIDTPRSTDVSGPNPEPVYKLYFNLHVSREAATCTCANSWNALYSSMQHNNKMKALLDSGFLSVNNKVSDGIILCKSIS